MLMPRQVRGTFWLPAAACELQLRRAAEGRRSEDILERRAIDATQSCEVVFEVK